MTDSPPMDPHTSEADARQLELACMQGEAYGEALRHMTFAVADAGGEHRAGDYLVGFAIEDAEGMYGWDDGRLVWEGPGDGNVHVEVSVRDAGDGRFVPGAGVQVTLVEPHGAELGPEDQPLVWHPMLYHYGRNWTVPCDGEYTIRVRVEPPRFMRHDEVNGKRFLRPVEVEFADVTIVRGRD